MPRKKISEQTRGRVIPPPNAVNADVIEVMSKKLTGARQALNLSFALWFAWRKSGELSNSDTLSQVTVTLSECLEMATRLTNTLDLLRTLTFGSQDFVKTTNLPEPTEKNALKQLGLWDVD